LNLAKSVLRQSFREAGDSVRKKALITVCDHGRNSPLTLG
jgi:hypothetical protein